MGGEEAIWSYQYRKRSEKHSEVARRCEWGREMAWRPVRTSRGLQTRRHMQALKLAARPCCQEMSGPCAERGGGRIHVSGQMQCRVAEGVVVEWSCLTVNSNYQLMSHFVRYGFIETCDNSAKMICLSLLPFLKIKGLLSEWTNV